MKNRYDLRTRREPGYPCHFSNFIISTYIHVVFLWFLQKNMRDADLISKYDSIIESRHDWNMERVLRAHLEEDDLFWSTRRYPYISYAVRNVDGPTRWSVGMFSEPLGYYIKYTSEHERALCYKRMYEDMQPLDIDDFYRKHLS